MPDNHDHLVFKEYEKRRKSDRLSPNLYNPTPASLRDECLIVYQEEGKPKDDVTLRAFFGAVNANEDYDSRISNFDIDRFRPLVNFLTGKTSSPSKKHLELLAWLLSQNEEATEVLGPLYESTDNEAKKEHFPPDNHKQDVLKTSSIPAKYYKSIAAFAAAIIVVVVAYVFYPDRNQCMYWTGDHYVSIACDQKALNPVIALDTFRISNLRKIGRRDTLTSASIKKVHYAKVKIDSVDFYTTGGDHPTNSNKRLLPLSQYILDKYVPKHQ